MRIFVDDYVQVRYVNLYNKKVSHDLKILAIGDVHISSLVSLKKISFIKKQMEREKADYIVFTGDLIDNIDDIENDDVIFKVNDLLSCAVRLAPTFVVLGNHDYIHKKNGRVDLAGVKKFYTNIKGVKVLDNDVYFDKYIWIMGYTETKKYYMKKEYDVKAFYDDFKSHKELYESVNKELPTLALIHSPEFSKDKKCVDMFHDYDLIICGHTHDGCVPFGFGNFKRGLISPKKTFFPKNVRGIRKLGVNYILITGGVVKIQKCAPRLLHPLNHFCPVQMDVVTLSNKIDVSIKKKWY